MSKFLLFAVLTIPLGLVLSPATAQDNIPDISPNAKADQLPTGRVDKLAIQESIAGYLIALNERDAELASSFWSDSGEWIAGDGTRVRGTQAIAVALANSFEQEPEGMQISLRDLTIRFVSPNVAIEDGVAVIRTPGTEDSEASYSVVHTKRNGKWKIDAVRETMTPISPARSSELNSLAWLVGDWADQVDGNISVETNCKWTAGNKSLRRSFRITDNGEVKTQGTQVIVWDARLGKIRSWMFDSQGGFGNGIWQNNGSQWTVDAEFQLADGGVATARNVYSRINDSSFEFQSVNRVVDGVAMENTPVVTVARSKQANISQAINPGMGQAK